jgi:hypothetical protein
LWKSGSRVVEGVVPIVRGSMLFLGSRTIAPDNCLNNDQSYAIKRRAIDTDETPQQIISTAVTNCSEVAVAQLPPLCHIRRGVWWVIKLNWKIIKLYLKIIRESYFYHSLSKLYNPFDD